MENIRDYAAVPHEYLEEMDVLSDAEFGRLVRFLLEYSSKGTTTALNGNERFYAKRVIAREDRYQKSYMESLDKRAAAGQAAANARWGNAKNANACERVRSDANACEGVRSDANACEGVRSNANHAYTNTNTKTKTETNTETKEAPPPTPSSDLEQVMNYYMDNIQAVPSPFAVEDLKRYTEAFGPDVVIHACAIAQDEGKRSWNYIRAILQRYEREKLTSMAMVTQDEQLRRDVQEAKQGKNRNVTAAEYEANRKRNEKPIGEAKMEELKKFAASFG